MYIATHQEEGSDARRPQRLKSFAFASIRRGGQPISLLSLMDKFQAGQFTHYATSLMGKMHLFGNSTNYENGVNSGDLATFLDRLTKKCELIDLTTTAALASDVKEIVEDPALHNADFMQTRLMGLHDTLIAELRSKYFLYLDGVEQKLYESEGEYSEDVANCFPDSLYDLEEAAKCLGLNRPTACVMHMMRAMEPMLEEVGRPLGISTKTNPSWHSFLTKFPAALNQHYGTADEGWRRKNGFYDEILADLATVKRVWRNPTMHAANKYDWAEANKIYSSVMDFAELLSSKMPIKL
jgi:hypothetical protein